MLPVRRKVLVLYKAREGSSCSCDHLRREEDAEGVVLEALRLAGSDECERERLLDDEGRDGGRSDAGAKERLSTESR